MVQQKDTAIAKQQRRAMAQLLEVCDVALSLHTYAQVILPHSRMIIPTDTIFSAFQQSKVESARIRIENIIRSDLTTELHEILELYCELLLARIGLLDPSSPSSQPPPDYSGAPIPPKEAQAYCDPGLEEAVHSIIHASLRTDIKELHTCRALLIERFGKEFGTRATEDRDGKVAERVRRRLETKPPERDLVDAYLAEIAKTYGVEWPEKSKKEGEESLDDESDDDDPEGKDGGQKELANGARQKEKPLEKPFEAEELSRATPPRDLGPRSPPVRVAPPSPSTENVTPKLKMPGAGEAKTGSKANAPQTNGKAESRSKRDDGPGGKVPDVDELAKRFAQLKR